MSPQLGREWQTHTDKQEGIVLRSKGCALLAYREAWEVWGIRTLRTGPQAAASQGTQVQALGYLWGSPRETQRGHITAFPSEFSTHVWLCSFLP